MKRTTVFLDQDAERELDLLASRRGEPKASLVREAIAEYLVRQRGAGAEPLAFIAVGRSGQHDVAEHHEELLFSSDADHPAPESTSAAPPAVTPGSRQAPARRRTRSR